MGLGGQRRIKASLKKFKDSGRLKDFLVFLVFVCIAAVFWFITALNSITQKSYEVNIVIDNVPDTVTFITLPPEKIHVNVRDKGSSLLRNQLTGKPALHINFKDFADNGRLRVSHASLSASMRHLFGSTATISSLSPDSLSIPYTIYPGRKLPVELVYDVTVAPGMVLGKPIISNKTVDAFSVMKNDTLRKLYTEKVVLRNLDKNTTVDVPVLSKGGTRVIPSTVSVTFVVEQLVKKESDVLVEADNIPIGRDILFFPSRVKVAYYVPMSKYNDNNTSAIKVQASFNEAVLTSSDKVGVKIVSHPAYMSNLELLQDSVEYTLVRSN